VRECPELSLERLDSTAGGRPTSVYVAFRDFFLPIVKTAFASFRRDTLPQTFARKMSPLELLSLPRDIVPDLPKSC